MAEDILDSSLLDASFEEIDITPGCSKLTKVSISSRNEDVDQLLSQAVNLNDSNIYHEPTCSICSSAYREDIEKKYLEKQSFLDAVKIFKEKTGQDIGENVVENHVSHHMTRGVRELQKVEYLHRIKRLNTPNITTLEKISFAYAIISERILGINSIVPGAEESVAEIEKIKSSETARLMGALNNLLKLQASILGEMKDSGELVYIPANEFVNVFRETLKAAKTDRERELITNLLDKLETLARKTK